MIGRRSRRPRPRVPLLRRSASRREAIPAIRPSLSWSSRIFLGDIYAAVMVREGCAPSPQLGLPADQNEFPGIPDQGCDAVALAVRECE